MPFPRYWELILSIAILASVTKRLRTLTPGVPRRSNSSLMLVEERFFDLTTPIKQRYRQKPMLEDKTCQINPQDLDCQDLLVPMTEDKTIQVNLRDLDLPNSNPVVTGTDQVNVVVTNNPFCVEVYRRFVMKTFLSKIANNSIKYSFSFSLLEFHICIMKFFDDNKALMHGNSFETFWSVIENRQLIIEDLKYVIGEELCKGRFYKSLSISMSNECVNLYKRKCKK